MRVAVYARVSTLRQAQQQTIDQQLERLSAHMQTQGWELPDTNIFRDDGYSGSTLNRPGLDQLRDRVRAVELDRVLITAPDRLARSYVQQAILLDEFKQYGCQIEFLDRPMSDDPNDQLLLQIRGAVAEYERTLIGERMRRGRQMKYRAGLLLPWTRAPYGYRVDHERPRDPQGVSVVEAEAVHVQDMFNWYLEEGHSLMGLTKRLQNPGVISPDGNPRWNTATVRGILTNPVYTGQVFAGRSRPVAARMRQSALRPVGRTKSTCKRTLPETWIPVAKIPALVSEDCFEQVQAKLAQNRQWSRRNNNAHQYLLRALVSCGACLLACYSRTCTKRNNDFSQTYYVCQGKLPPVHSHRNERCPSSFIPADQLDALVWADVCEILTHPESIKLALERAHGGAWLPQELQARRQVLQKARATITHQVDRLTDAYLAGTIPLAEYQRRRAGLEKNLQALDNQERQLDGHTNRQTEITRLIQSADDFCSRVASTLTTATFEQKRALVELLIDRVVVTGDKVEIRYAIPVGSAGETGRFCHLRKDYFDAPVTSDGISKFLDVVLQTGDKEVDAMFDLVFELAGTFDKANAAQLPPAFMTIEVFKVIRIIDQDMAAGFDASVAFVLGGEGLMLDRLEVIRNACFVGFNHLGIQVGLIVFEGKDILPTLFHNDAGILGLTVGRINGYDAATQH
jgi:site-specific DNA recombinase